MNPDAVRSKIQLVTQKLTDEILAVFGETFAAAASEFGISGKPKVPRKAGRKPKAPQVAKTPKTKEAAPKAAKRFVRAAAAPKSATAKGERRSSEALVVDAERVAKLLAGNKSGLRIEQINAKLGTSTKQLARPISKLLVAGRIKKTGEKRGTVYFPA